MEARRTFQTGAKSSKQFWLVVAALLVAFALGMAAPYLVKGPTSASAPSSGHVVQTSVQGSDQDRNAQAPATINDRRLR